MAYPLHHIVEARILEEIANSPELDAALEQMAEEAVDSIRLLTVESATAILVIWTGLKWGSIVGGTLIFGPTDTVVGDLGVAAGLVAADAATSPTLFPAIAGVFYSQRDRISQLFGRDTA